MNEKCRIIKHDQWSFIIEVNCFLLIFMIFWYVKDFMENMWFFETLNL